MDELEGLQGIVLQADAGAAALDAPPTPQDGAENAAGGPLALSAGPNFEAEAGGMVEMFAGLLCGFVPEASRIWTPEAKQATAATLAPVLQKHGVSLGGMPCELVFAVTAGPLLWHSARLLAAKMAEAKRQAEAARTVDGETRIVPAAGQPGAPEAAGPVVHPQMALYTGGGG